MAGMKTAFVALLLGLCPFVCVVHGVSVAQPDDAVEWNTEDDKQGGGHLVPDNGFHYKFEQTNGGGTFNSDQFSESTFSKQTEESSFSDESYVFDAKSQDGDAPYDYNSLFATQQDEPASTSYAVGVPEERVARPKYVFDATAGDASFFTLDAQGSSDGQAVNDEAASFTTLDTEHGNDEVVPAAGHHGPVSYYTPSSNADGAFHFYDPRTEGQKKATSILDADDPATGQSFAQYQDASGDSTTASTASIFASTRAPRGTHGCPNTYWAKHTKQWPKELKTTTPICKAFGGLNLRKNLEIIYGTTTVYQALLDARPGPYSKLLRNAAAALLNAYAKSAYSYKPAEVSRLFHTALASKTAAAAQALKFENENHAFGDRECE